MARIAHLIVRLHKLLLAVVVVATAVAALGMTRVVVNEDMTAYMPDTMRAKQGMSEMASQFGDATSVRVMFYGLTEDEKAALSDDLLDVRGVNSVTFDEDDVAFDCDGYSLYALEVAGGTYSAEAHETLGRIRAHLADEGYELGGEGQDCWVGGPVAGTDLGYLGPIIGFAVALLMVILLVMAHSWVEPILMMATVGMAIVLGMGTNVIFASVSSVTNSIASVLQLVLSMDYSIMLMDMYRQQRARTDDKRLAMERALTRGIGAIASSSLTTVVGMLCLLAMTFTIGRDMGLVLAKGVAFSLLCVFFAMPGLLLVFDGAIRRTEKRAPDPGMALLARAEYRGRVPVLVALVVLVVVSFGIKGLASASFTMAPADADSARIDGQFGADNTVVVLYPAADEDAARDLELWLSDELGEARVSAYGTTLAKARTTQDLSAYAGMDPDEVSLIYYHHANGGAVPPMAVGDFAQFLREQASAADAGATGGAQALGQLGEDERAGLDRLCELADADEADRARGMQELADYLGMERSEVEQLTLAYLVATPDADVSTGRMTPADFVTFVADDIVGSDAYAGMVPMTAEQQTQLQAARAAIDLTPAAASVALGVDDMAESLGMDRQDVRAVYLLRAYEAGETDGWSASAHDLLDFACDSEDVTGRLTESQLTSMRALRDVMDGAVAGTTYAPAEMAELLGRLGATADGAGEASETDEVGAGAGGLASLDEPTVRMLYLYRATKAQGRTTDVMSLEQFVNYAAQVILHDDAFSGVLDDEARARMLDAQAQMEDGKAKLVGDAYGRISVRVPLERESPDMTALLDELNGRCERAFGQGAYYLVGDAPMAWEARDIFASDLNRVTLLSVVAIFLIVAVTFRSAFVALVLVALIQGSINLTMGVTGMLGISTYYVALVVVQAILMGATIDYAILYTSAYRHARAYLGMGVSDAVRQAYRGSVATMITSGGILFIVTLVIGIAASDPTVSQVCLTIARGSAVAILSVALLLPGALAALDRLVVSKRLLRRAARRLAQ